LTSPGAGISATGFWTSPGAGTAALASPGAGTSAADWGAAPWPSASDSAAAAFLARRAFRALRSFPFFGALKTSSLSTCWRARWEPAARRRIETSLFGCQRHKASMIRFSRRENLQNGDPRQIRPSQPSRSSLVGAIFCVKVADLRRWGSGSELRLGGRLSHANKTHARFARLDRV
jgi:hypothetical protein